MNILDIFHSLLKVSPDNTYTMIEMLLNYLKTVFGKAEE
jgi:hypothetical protein